MGADLFFPVGTGEALARDISGAADESPHTSQTKKSYK
jgi:hypothetical protein